MRAEGGEDDGFHDGIAGKGGMDFVVRQTGFETALFIDHSAVIVHKKNVMLLRIRADEFIERTYLLRHVRYGRMPVERTRRERRTEDRTDTVRLRQFAHRDDIAQNMPGFDDAVVLRDVVRAAEDDDRLGMEVNHVLAEAHEQFRGRLTAYAAPDEAVRGEELRVNLIPNLRDAVAIENDADWRMLRLQLRVLRRIETELRPVVAWLSRDE